MTETLPKLNLLVRDLVLEYTTIYPAESNGLQELDALVAAGVELNNSRTVPGHITGSALMLSPDRRQLLLIHHNFLQRWLQPGGHMEADETTPLQTARREVVEETSVVIADYVAFDADNVLLPIDIDSHIIPANPAKQMPAHTHHDFRYVFIAESLQLSHQIEEVSQAAWVDLDDSRLNDLGRIGPKLRNLQLRRDHPTIAT